MLYWISLEQQILILRLSLRFLGSDTPQGFYIGSVVMSYPEIMGTMEQALIKEDKLPDRSVFSKATPHKVHKLEIKHD